MREISDRDVMKKVRELDKDLGPGRETYAAFRKKYSRYLAEQGRNPEAEEKVCKPYIKYFPEK